MVSGKVKLSIILYVSSENGSSIEAAPSGVRQLIDNYNLSLFVTKVNMGLLFLSASSTVS